MQNNIPNELIGGLKAIKSIKKILSNHLNFEFDDLDDAVQLQDDLKTVHAELSGYNQLIRTAKIKQQENANKQAEMEAKEKPVMKKVEPKVNEDDG